MRIYPRIVFLLAAFALVACAEGPDPQFGTDERPLRERVEEAKLRQSICYYHCGSLEMGACDLIDGLEFAEQRVMCTDECAYQEPDIAFCGVLPPTPTP
jgi:hypothetical protein